jgi:putative ABC transport system ATP-binding protein
MLQLHGLSKRFFRGTANEVVALDALDLVVHRGDYVSVIGSNGAGKSTLLNAVAGQVPVDAGRILLNGVDVTRTPEHARARLIGRIDQDPRGSTAAAMSIAENLAMAAKRGRSRGLRNAVNAEKRAWFRELLSELELGLEDRVGVQVGALSGGQRQALALIMATLGDPLLLLLDEHTAALDPKTARQVMEMTGRVIDRRALTAVMVTHNMDHAIRWGNRLIMMNAGRIVLDIPESEKRYLTVPDLIDQFQRKAGEAFTSDRALLLAEETVA